MQGWHLERGGQGSGGWVGIWPQRLMGFWNRVNMQLTCSLSQRLACAALLSAWITRTPRGPRGGKGCKNRSGHVGVRGDGRRGDVSSSKALSRFRGQGWGHGLSPEFPASIHLAIWIKATSALPGDAPQFGPKYPLSFSTHPSPACFFSMCLYGPGPAPGTPAALPSSCVLRLDDSKGKREGLPSVRQPPGPQSK